MQVEKLGSPLAIDQILYELVALVTKASLDVLICKKERVPYFTFWTTDDRNKTVSLHR